MTDRNTVVVKDGSGGSSTGVLLGVVLIILVLAGIWYFALGPGAGSSGSNPDTNINVNLPSLEIPAPS
jgi:hypothetical protein